MMSCQHPAHVGLRPRNDRSSLLSPAHNLDDICQRSSLHDCTRLAAFRPAGTEIQQTAASPRHGARPLQALVHSQQLLGLLALVDGVAVVHRARAEDLRASERRVHLPHHVSAI